MNPELEKLIKNPELKKNPELEKLKKNPELEKSAIGEKIDIWFDEQSYRRGLFIAVGVVLTIVITLFLIWYFNNYCLNTNPKAKNGDCCKYGKTIKKQVCYKTSCKNGERNVNGYCCENGVSHQYYSSINCLTSNCPKDDMVVNKRLDGNGNYLCCLYGVTIHKENCYKTSCQNTLYGTPHPRTINGKCCLNGVTVSYANCNSTKCDQKNCSKHGKCCYYGVAVHSSYCNTIKTRGGAYVQNCNSFANYGTCCINGKTAHNDHCNQKCSYHNGISGNTRNGNCCEFGVSHQEYGCNISSNCHGKGKNKAGDCCQNGVAWNTTYCNDNCGNPNSCHGNNGNCIPPYSCY
jgi:hypothetical protein